MVNQQQVILLEWQDANRPLSVIEKAIFSRMDLDAMSFVLDGLAKMEWRK